MAWLRAGESGPCALSTCVGVVALAMSGTIRGSELQAANGNRHTAMRQPVNRIDVVIVRKIAYQPAPVCTLQYRTTVARSDAGALGALPNRLRRQVG